MGSQAPEAGPRGSRPDHCRAPCPGMGSKNRVAGTPQEALGHGLQRPGEVTGLGGAGGGGRSPGVPSLPPTVPARARAASSAAGPLLGSGLATGEAFGHGEPPLRWEDSRTQGRQKNTQDQRAGGPPSGRWGGPKKPRTEGQHGQSRGRDARAGRRLGRGHLAGRRQASGLAVLLGS